MKSLHVRDVAGVLSEAFERIHRERMAGLPILHPELSVAVVGGREWQGDWLGVLVTPWCMNLVLVPGPASRQMPGAVGTKQQLDLPAGCFELIANEEAGVGRFAACSLFSPMQALTDQAAAVATAEAVMSGLFVDPRASPAGEAVTVPDARHGISRRDLLRGSFRR